MQQVPGLVEVLKMLAEAVGVGAVVAFLFEKLGWFQKMAPNTKWWTILVISLGLPLLAQLALQFVPADVWAQLEPYWHTLALGFVAWAVSQAAHLVEKRLQG